jgi:hypothetical protein
MRESVRLRDVERGSDGTVSSSAGTTSISSFTIADVGLRIVTIGPQRNSVSLGIGFPHSKQCVRSSGLTVPQEEQYTGFKIAAQ